MNTYENVQQELERALASKSDRQARAHLDKARKLLISNPPNPALQAASALTTLLSSPTPPSLSQMHLVAKSCAEYLEFSTGPVDVIPPQTPAPMSAT